MQNNNRSFLASIMPVTRHLLVINIIVWLATLVCEQTGTMDLNRWLGLHFWKGSEFNIIQLFICSATCFRCGCSAACSRGCSGPSVSSFITSLAASALPLFKNWCGSSRGRASLLVVFRDPLPVR